MPRCQFVTMTATQLASRALIRLSPQQDNEDPADFLQGLVTSDVKGALPVWAGLLSAQGKTLFDFVVWRDGRDILLDCEADAADDLTKRLSLYRLRRKIGIERDETLAVHWSPEPQGPGAADPRLADLGWRWFGTPDIDEQGSTADAAWLAHRLALGVPEGRAELGDVLWLETNAVELNGVSFSKGCYVGQENTARMNWRQKVNRRLVVVPLALSEAKRCKIAYPDLGLAVDHRRIEDLVSLDLPAWQADSIAAGSGGGD